MTAFYLGAFKVAAEAGAALSGHFEETVGCRLRSLGPAQFARMICNEWVTSESSIIDMAHYDASPIDPHGVGEMHPLSLGAYGDRSDLIVDDSPAATGAGGPKAALLGSPAVLKTIGMVVVAALAASTAGVSLATITATRRRTRSAASAFSRSY
jgi:hypothetical protein